MRVELALAADDAEIRRLLRENPVAGAIRLSFEAEPCSATAGAIQGELHQVVVARDETSGRLIGMGSRSVGRAFVNGRAQPLGYLAQLRVDRGRSGGARLVREGYALLARLHADGRAPFYVTTIAEDNAPARRLLEAGLPELPRYRRIGRYLTLVLSVGRPRAAARPAVAIERARPEDLPALVACLQRNGRRRQFHPVWSAEELGGPRASGLRLEDFHVARRGGEVVGCAAVWDQRAFKQAVVRGYDARLALLRPLVNAARPLLGGPRLPRAGQALRHAFLSHLAVDGDDPDVARALLAAALADAGARRGLDTLALGFAEFDPLLAAAAALPHRRYASVLYAVHWPDGAAAVDALDGRTPHLETAIL